MANLAGVFGNNGFDPSTAEAAQGFAPLPTDVAFHFEIGEADLVDTTKGGQQIKLRCNVLAPSHEGRCTFERLNIVCGSEKAEQIAQSNLKMICEAVGIDKLEDTDQLIGVQFLAHVRTRPAKDGYDAQSELDYSTITALDGAQMPAKNAPAKNVPPAGKPNAGKPTANAGAKAPPWAKNKAA